MSISDRPYKSRLFNFFNRRSLQFRDRVGEAFRHLKVAAEWGAQVLISPLYWIFQPKEWTGNVLGKASSDQALPSLADTYLSDPPVDRPLEKILTAIEPWFELSDLLPEVPSENAPRKREIVLSQKFFQHIQQQIETTVPLTPQNLALSPASEQKALTPRPLNQLVSQIKNAFSFAQTSDLIIRGIACVMENRQLVLTTADNEILDVLSLEQQRTLNQSIRTEMANFWYERRLEWSVSQKFLGIIPLVNQETENILPPVQLLLRTLHWLETQSLSPKLQNLTQSALVPTTAIIPVGNALIQKLDQKVAALENQEIPFSQPIFQQISQRLQTIRHSAVVESSLEKTGQIIHQIGFPEQLQKLGESPQLNQLKHLNSEFLERISRQLTQSNLSGKIALNNNPENSLVSPNFLEETPADPFQIQILIQAAIAYFFGQKSASPHFSEQNKTSLVGSTESIEDPWLAWEDLFIDRSQEIQGQTLPLRGIPRRKALNSGKSSKITKKSQKNSKISRSKSQQLSKSAVQTSTTTRTNFPTASEITATLEEEIETALMPTNSIKTDLEAAPDWIETEAKPMGYLKHPLERILEWLDIVVLWLEENVRKIWHWLRNRSQTI